VRLYRVESVSLLHHAAPFQRISERRQLVRAGAASMERIHLSVYDQIVEQLYLSRIFFYERAPDEDALRGSLARVLQRFGVFSGRLVRVGKHERALECCDAGVVFETVRASGRLPAYGPEHDALADFGHFIETPTLTLAPVAKRPLLIVRLTRFEHGGAALAVRSSHAVTDGHGFYDFMLAWAAEHQRRPYPSPSQSRDVLDAIGKDEPSAATNPRFEVLGPATLVLFIARLLWHERRFAHTTLRFGAEELASAKAAVMAELHDGQWVSTNDVLTARLWQAFAAATASQPGDTNTLALVRTLRELTDPPLGPDFYGNCGALTLLSHGAQQLAAATPAELSLAIRDVYAETSPATIRVDTAFLVEQRRQGRLVRTLSRLMRRIYARSVMLNNWSQLPMYELDFGHGTPFWAEFPAAPLPMFVLAPTPGDKGARDVRISLPKAIMPGVLERLARPR
jgi:shikimate O-hydroxycinnamoyltransferase